jgi:hypothetical protein
MWRPLSDESHSEECPEGSQLRILLAAIRCLPNSRKVYGHWSANAFLITTVPEYALVANDSCIASIEYDAPTERILIGFSDSGGRWGMWQENGYWVRVGKWAYCDQNQATALIRQVIEQSLAHRPAPGERNPRTI